MHPFGKCCFEAPGRRLFIPMRPKRETQQNGSTWPQTRHPRVKHGGWKTRLCGSFSVAGFFLKKKKVKENAAASLEKVYFSASGVAAKFLPSMEASRASLNSDSVPHGCWAAAGNWYVKVSCSSTSLVLGEPADLGSRLGCRWRRRSAHYHLQVPLQQVGSQHF